LAQRDKGEEQTRRGAGKSNDGCLYRRIEECLEQGCAADAQERVLTHAAGAASPGNSGGDQGGEHDARGAEEEEQHVGVERVVSHPVEPRGEIVRERCASARSRLEVVRHSTHRLIRTSGVRGQAGAVEKDVELGEAARVGLAVALALAPSVILADEPTAEVDAATEKELVQLLSNHCAAGGTVVVATHSETLATIASRVIRLQDGRIIDDAADRQG
jgi:putative ABC transport system ATP-binding protein